MEELLEENLKLIEIVERTKKKFHERVNIIYRLVNIVKSE